jgi:hypothetical protein
MFGGYFLSYLDGAASLVVQFIGYILLSVLFWQLHLYGGLLFSVFFVYLHFTKMYAIAHHEDSDEW